MFHHPPPPPAPCPPTVVAHGQMVITGPEWIRRPGASDVEAAYPRAAYAARIRGGWGAMSCAVTDKGALDACHVTAEDPPGQGFGEATLKLARFYKMKPTLADGRSVGGATIEVRVRFVAPDR